jgi:hypothetical protein
MVHKVFLESSQHPDAEDGGRGEVLCQDLCPLLIWSVGLTAMYKSSSRNRLIMIRLATSNKPASEVIIYS